MDADATIAMEDTVVGTVSEIGGYGFAVSSASNSNLVTNVLFDRVFVKNATSTTTLKPTGVEFPDLTLQTTAGLSPATAASTYQTLAGMGSYLTTSAAASTYQTLAGMSSYLTTSAAASTYYLQTNPDGFIGDAPSDGSQYARQDGAWEVVSGGGGAFLPLAGGTMTGAIVFDGTSGQYINKGNFDSGRGGNFGLSLVCSIGYEFNWQAGWLTTTNQGSTTPRPLYLDSLAGTTLRSWDSATDTGVEVAHTGVNVSNSSIYYVNFAPDLLKVFEATNELGVSIAHDSIAIQHIDTPNQTAYMTNEYIGFEDLSGTPHSAYVEHDVITVQDATDTTQMRSTGLTLSAGGSITFGDSTVQTTAYTGGGVPEAPIDNYVYGRVNALWVRVPSVAPFLQIATGINSPLTGWSATGAEFYLTAAGNVVLDLPSSLTYLSCTGNAGAALNVSSCPALGTIIVNSFPTVGTFPGNLTSVTFDYCTFTSPPTLSSPSNITTYTLANSSITTAPSFNTFYNIATCNVYNNASMATTPTFDSNSLLTSVVLQNNTSMTSAPYFANAPLTYLNMSGCTSMTTYPTFAGAVDLSYVNVGNCAISNCDSFGNFVYSCAQTYNRSYGFFDLSGGTNQAFDSTALPYWLTELTGTYGWTVIYNSY
jgi:hypothetical protein